MASYNYGRPAAQPAPSQLTQFSRDLVDVRGEVRELRGLARIEELSTAAVNSAKVQA